ncbi:Transposase IS200-like domain-containing protein [Desulfonema magnum]|uniref:Transposase IS200-like domain-containing protein n=2 Tax=Desulfonema magnum TaxID=45655 RepID=A0A975BSS3_9BACT|nr:Transposase IS200-like domain-containing protein [Desulfonema magnum]
MMKSSEHTPIHLFADNSPYFITGAIYKKRPLLENSDIKKKLSELIRKYFAKYNWELHHWVVLNNHYHVMGKSRRGDDLVPLIRNIHRTSAIRIHKLTRCGKPVWWNYWDYCPRNEKEYMTRVNYLLNNPVKHGYVRNLRNYPFSSFHTLYEEKGRDELIWQFKKYPDYSKLVLPEKKDDF